MRAWALILLLIIQAAVRSGEVRLGSSREEVLTAYGLPQGLLWSSKKEIMVFKGNVVVKLKDGKVVEIQNPPSPSIERPPKPTQPSEPASRPTSPTNPPAPLTETVSVLPKPAVRAAPARPAGAPRPRRTLDPARMSENFHINGLLEMMGLCYSILANAPLSQGTIIFNLDGRALVVSGFPKSFLKTGRTQILVSMGSPSLTPGTEAAEINPRAAKATVLYDGFTEEEYLRRVLYGDRRDAQIRAFVSNCRVHHDWLTNASNSAPAVFYTRQALTLKVKGIPPTLLRNGKTEVTMNAENPDFTYDGLDSEEFLDEVYW